MNELTKLPLLESLAGLFKRVRQLSVEHSQVWQFRARVSEEIGTQAFILSRLALNDVATT